MDRKRWWPETAVAFVLTALAAVGCDDRSTARSARPASSDRSSAPAATPPADAAAQTAGSTRPATHPADTQPANSFLTIDGRILEFPSARLRLTRTEEGVRALLFSNDPKEAISANYRGNSYYFDMPLKIAGPEDIADGEYAYKAPSSESAEESPDGIFLNGMRTHLQPQDIAITFEGEPNKVIARLAGRFLVINTTGETAPSQFAAVTGTLFMTAEVKGE